LEFKKNHGRIITKAIKYPFFFRERESYLSAGGTRLVDYKDIEDLNDYFFVSIFQEYIEKKYEIRVFFFEDKYYPMAIFSQNDEGTKIDFRNYNREKPNRCVPIKLPKIILSKLNNLMCEKNLNSGSIDIIVTPENDFVFLEVNPQGQFHWLSESCNYYIEREIANSL
jgi:glutathione synthase/RimK-type ligase-like ATP-grasp enzyme